MRVTELMLRGAQHIDDAVRPHIAHKTGRRPRHQSAQRRRYTASLGITDECGDAGWPCKTDTDRMLDAATAQPLEPVDDMLAGERELAHNVYTQSLRGRTGNFLVNRGFKPLGRNTRVTFRVSADTDLLDAVRAQITLLNHSQRIGIRSRGIGVAANDQKAAHAGFAGETLEHIWQRLDTLQSPGGNMNDRLEPGVAQRGSRFDGFFGSARWNGSDVNRCARVEDFAKLRNLIGAWPGRLDREIECKIVCGHARARVHSRRREMTNDSS